MLGTGRARTMARMAPTEVNRRPGSPNLERHEISSRPRGITAPGGCITGKVGTLVGERMYMYCRTAWGCMSAIEPENNCCRACVPSCEGSGSGTEKRFPSDARQPSAHSSSIRSNHMVSCVIFWMWTSRNIFSRSRGWRRAEGDFGTWTLVLTDKGLVTCPNRHAILNTHIHAGGRTKTYQKLVKFPKALQARVVRPLHWPRCIRIPRRKPIRDRTRQHVLTEFLHLMMYDMLEAVPR